MRSFVSLAALALLMPALVWAGPVDINSADAATLAEAIVAYRTKNGPFKSADDLALVKGIGQKVIDENRANIRVERVAKPPAAPAKPASPGH